MRFLLDENVPRAVGAVLVEAGHDVVEATAMLPVGSPDQIVATAAAQDKRILVSHDRDMRCIERSVSTASLERYRTLSRLMLCCSEPDAASRVKMFLPIIAAEFERVARLDDKRMFFEIGLNRVRIHR